MARKKIADYLEMRKNRRGNWYYVVKALNGIVLAKSESYSSKSVCKKMVDNLAGRHSGFKVVTEEETK